MGLLPLGLRGLTVLPVCKQGTGRLLLPEQSLHPLGGFPSTLDTASVCPLGDSSAS